MAEYDPPLEDLPIFDNLVFVNPDDYVTIGYANTHYLKFPSAQGTENLQAINVNGLATFNNDINVSDGAYIEIKDSQDNIIITDNTPTTITTANNNVIIGTDIATSITTANNNVLIGKDVFLNNTFGQYNVCIGEDIMVNAPTGPFCEYNVMLGNSAGKENVGSTNVFVGTSAGEQNTTGSNTYIGVYAGGNVQGDNNVAIGNFALSGSFNVNPALNINDRNMAIGSSALYNCSTGTKNVAIGIQSLRDLTTGSKQVAIGDDCVENLITGTDSVFIGSKASQHATSGTHCVIIGANANDDASNTTPLRNTCIGADTDNMNYRQSSAIGYGATNTAINQIRLGTATETVSCPGSLTFRLTEDNTNGTYYIPFSKSAAGVEGALFVDTVTSPLSYNPSVGRLTTTEYSGSLYNNQTVNGSVGFGTVTTSGAVNIATSLSTGALSIGTGLTTGNITIGPSASGSPSSNVTIMGRGGWTGTFQVGGNSVGASILLAAPVTCNYTIQTSNTVAPTTTRMLGYTTTKTTGWSNITNAASNINSITIDGASIGFGVYRIELFINYTNGAATQDFRIGVSSTSATLQAPLSVRSTTSGLDDGVYLSQTISAYTSTTFYIVAQSSNAAGATLYTSGVRNSTINLTRIA